MDHGSSSNWNLKGLAEARSLRMFWARGGCCAEEIEQVETCRYDWERLGCGWSKEPEDADVLIISGGLSDMALEGLRAVYRRMPEPKYVLAIGACACQAASAPDYLPIDVFVPGCPPRPESILHGVMTLREKIEAGRG